MGVPVTLANTLAIAGGDMLSFTMMLRVHGWSKLFDDLAAGLDDKKSDSIGRWRLFIWQIAADQLVDRLKWTIAQAVSEVAGPNFHFTVAEVGSGSWLGQPLHRAGRTALHGRAFDV